MVSVDIQEAERQTSEMRKTVQSLRSQLVNERRNLEYTKSLLVDSEATVERLSAQATILKAEIRRHERNAERERHLGDHNTNSDDTSNSLDAAPAGETRTEYLKNVLLRFLCADPSLGGGGASGASERNALVPVLATLLALSPTERAALQQVAETGLLRASTVTAEDGASGEEGSSWSSFLPSWLGG
ncbi:GRIP and coiled-coil domain-containing protein [Echinococcus granulosus]|uniref:GRIP and coiled-coil domain-containing protein n=1 Tax=Echinococcus granulosus TaxID=6210 RepID=W6VBC5_ECHGR|nr:GRIP and coiled-coil domain-containing protein [Echinococcus granulosus]EUB64109.1 GRIP and coiled-coil domain-containing protein [Echinococcus granulosus]